MANHQELHLGRLRLAYHQGLAPMMPPKQSGQVAQIHFHHVPGIRLNYRTNCNHQRMRYEQFQGARDGFCR